MHSPNQIWVKIIYYWLITKLFKGQWTSDEISDEANLCERSWPRSLCWWGSGGQRGYWSAGQVQRCPGWSLTAGEPAYHWWHRAHQVWHHWWEGILINEWSILYKAVTMGHIFPKIEGILLNKRIENDILKRKKILLKTAWKFHLFCL